MSQQTKDVKRTGPEGSRRLKTLFEKWAQEDAKISYRNEPSWEDFKKALNDGRPADGKPFSEK